MSSWLRLTLITLTVGGGFTGVAITSQALFSSQMNGPPLIVMYCVFVLLYAFVLVAGLLVAHNPQRIMPLVVALSLQIPVIYSPIVAFRFGAGLVAIVGLNEGGYFWWLRFGADWQLNLLQRLPFGVGINLVPVVLLAATHWSVRRHSLARAQNVRCPTCGYDLRESPDRCPECGTVK